MDEEITELLTDQNNRSDHNNFTDSSNNESESIKMETMNFEDNSLVSEESICHKCNIAFSNTEILRIHIQKRHSKLKQSEAVEKGYSNKSDVPKNKVSIDKRFICPKCPLMFVLQSSIPKHIKEVHEKIKDYVCEECPYKTTSKMRLEFHQADKHGIDTGRKKLKCSKCPHETFYKTDLKIHYNRLHLGNKIKTYVCEKCPYRADQKMRLEVHQANKHDIDIGREKLKCGKCPYETFIRSHLKRHIKNIKHLGNA